jgi:putative ABC transport system permease protein
LDFWSDLFEGTRFEGYAYNLATFEVGNVSEYEAIKDEILNLDFNWNRYNLVDASELLSTLSSNFSGMEQLSEIMFWGIFAAGFAMLWLIFILWVRNRNHEVAILLAVGTEKVKIVTQFIFEALLVAGVSFGLTVLSLPVANQLIDVGELAAQFQQEEVKMIEIDGEWIEMDPAAFAVAESETLDDLLAADFTEMATSSVSITPGMAAGVMVSLVGLIGVSILMAMIPVMRMKPKEIFSKMS